MSDLEAIRRRLWALAQLHASSLGMEDDALKEVRKLVDKAVARIKKDQAESDGARIDLAEQNLARIMYSTISTQQGVRAGPVTAESLSFALNSLCPIWPFC